MFRSHSHQKKNRIALSEIKKQKADDQEMRVYSSSKKMNSEDDMMWQFAIAITPTRENLEKAEAILKPLFAKEQLGFQIVLNPQSQNRDMASYTIETRHSDADFCGQEVMGLVRYSAPYQSYEKTPAQLKALMLKIWKALQDNDIEMGHADIPMHFQELAVANGSLPSIFSISAKKPTLGRHGVLLPEIYNEEARLLLEKEPEITKKYKNTLVLTHVVVEVVDEQGKVLEDNSNEEVIKTDKLSIHNPLQYPNPFEGIEFTLEDLRQSGITLGDVLRINHERMQYLVQRQNNAREAASYITFPDMETASIVDEYQKLQLAYEALLTDADRLEFLLQNKNILISICDNWVRLSESTLKKVHLIDILQENLESLPRNIDDRFNNISNILTGQAEGSDQLIDQARGLMMQIQQDFAKYLPNNHYKNLQQMINKNPAQVQLAFRKQIHIQNLNQRGMVEFDRIVSPVTKHALAPIFTAIRLLSETNSPQHLKLRKQLVVLQGELYKQCVAAENEPAKVQSEEAASLIDIPANAREAHELAKASLDMVTDILRPGTNKEEALSSIERFEADARKHSAFTKPAWKSVAKAVGCVILAAVGAVVGAAIGAAVEGALMTAIAGPAGGVLGVTHGLFKGSITGWSIGMMAASGLGMTAGFAGGLFAMTKRDQVGKIVHEAEEVANTMPSRHR